MAESTTGEDFEVARWYTRARKFPKLIGRLPSGERLYGGPYTITQTLGGIAAIVIGYLSMPLWARFGMVGNLGVAACTLITVVKGLGFIPETTRNPLSMGTGFIGALAAPPRGLLAGKRSRIPATVTLQRRLIVFNEAPAASTSSTTRDEMPGGVPVTAPPAAGDEPAAPTHDTPDVSVAAASSMGVGTSSSRPSGVGPALSGVQALLAGMAAAPTTKDSDV